VRRDDGVLPPHLPVVLPEVVAVTELGVLGLSDAAVASRHRSFGGEGDRHHVGGEVRRRTGEKWEVEELETEVWSGSNDRRRQGGGAPTGNQMLKKPSGVMLSPYHAMAQVPFYKMLPM
jgi:hypothetical protein